MVKHTVVAFRLDHRQAQSLRRAAREDGRLVSGYLRALVEKALAEAQQTAGAAQ